jgi:hypothetical protein
MLIWLHFLDTYTLKAVGQEEFADVKVPEAPALIRQFVAA